MARIDKENYYLDIAETVLKRATCLRRTSFSKRKYTAGGELRPAPKNLLFFFTSRSITLFFCLCNRKIISAAS